MSASLISKQVHAETFPDGAPIRFRYARVRQVVGRPFGRAKLYDLLARGEIKSFSLKERGALRGIRLIDLDSLNTYLERKATEAQEAAA